MNNVNTHTPTNHTRARIRFAIRSRLIYSKMVMTSEPSRSHIPPAEPEA
jgi:hypothetical protein